MPTAFVGRKLSLLTVKSEHEFFPADEVPWTADGPGTSQRVLSHDPEDGTLTRLARWAPGTDTSPAGVIRHEYYEEVYLLEGSLTDLTLGQSEALAPWPGLLLSVRRRSRRSSRPGRAAGGAACE